MLQLLSGAATQVYVFQDPVSRRYVLQVLYAKALNQQVHARLVLSVPLAPSTWVYPVPLEAFVQPLGFL